MNKTKRLSIDPQIRSAHSGYRDQGQGRDYAKYILFFCFCSLHTRPEGEE